MPCQEYQISSSGLLIHLHIFFSPRNDNRDILTQKCIMATITSFSSRNVVKEEKTCYETACL